MTVKDHIAKSELLEAIEILESQGKDVSTEKALIEQMENERNKLIETRTQWPEGRYEYWDKVLAGEDGTSGIIKDLLDKSYEK